MQGMDPRDEGMKDETPQPEHHRTKDDDGASDGRYNPAPRVPLSIWLGPLVPLGRRGDAHLDAVA